MRDHSVLFSPVVQQEVLRDTVVRLINVDSSMGTYSSHSVVPGKSNVTGTGIGTGAIAGSHRTSSTANGGGAGGDIA
jgi:hypothetical protein